MNIYITTTIAILFSATGEASDISSNETVLTMEKMTITAEQMKPFWSSTENLKATLNGIELTRFEKDDIAGISIERALNEPQNEFRPIYSTREQWLKAVVRPYMKIIQTGEKDGIFTAICDAGANRLAFLFYEKNSQRSRQHIVIVVDAAGNIISKQDETIMLVRKYTRTQTINIFQKPDPKTGITGASGVENKRDYKFLEGIIIPISKPQSGMRLIYKNPFIDEFESMVRKVGLPETIARITPHKISEFN